MNDQPNTFNRDKNIIQCQIQLQIKKVQDVPQEFLNNSRINLNQSPLQNELPNLENVRSADVINAEVANVCNVGHSSLDFIQNFNGQIPVQQQNNQNSRTAFDPQHQTNERKGCIQLTKRHRKKSIALGIVTIFLIILAIGILLQYGLFLTINQPIQKYKKIACDLFPIQCQNVPYEVIRFILTNYAHPDQARSLLQVSSSFTLLQNTAIYASRRDFINVYRKITRSAQCLRYNLEDASDVAFQTLSKLQFTNQAQLEKYIKMTESFSGQPLRLSIDASVEMTCRFNMTQGTRRRRLQQNQTTTSNCTRKMSVLIYFNGLGYSPSSVISNLYKMQQILSGNLSTNFDGGIIALGAWRNDGSIGFLFSLVQAYESQLRHSNSAVPSRMDMFSVLKNILDLSTTQTNLPSTISNQFYINFVNYFKRKSIQSFLYQGQKYYADRHRDFVVQQIKQGKKVVLVAHGQGTVYADKVYRLLTTNSNSTWYSEFVTLVYIAPTLSSMADGYGGYITNPNDKVISSMIYLAPLAANQVAVNFSTELDFGMNHELYGYVNAYKSSLRELIASAKQIAVQPHQAWGFGLISALLNWDNYHFGYTQFVQLNGSYYQLFSGSNSYNSYQDDDDRFRHVTLCYTSCTIPTGNYTLRTFSYYWYEPLQMIVTVAAGTQYLIKAFTIQLNMTTYNICVINVQKNQENGEYLFTISQ